MENTSEFVPSLLLDRETNFNLKGLRIRVLLTKKAIHLSTLL